MARRREGGGGGMVCARSGATANGREVRSKAKICFARSTHYSKIVFLNVKKYEIKFRIYIWIFYVRIQSFGKIKKCLRKNTIFSASK